MSVIARVESVACTVKVTCRAECRTSTEPGVRANDVSTGCPRTGSAGLQTAGGVGIVAACAGATNMTATTVAVAARTTAGVRCLRVTRERAPAQPGDTSDPDDSVARTVST